MNFNFTNSSAVASVSTQDDTATITFMNGRSYDYTVANIQAFTTALNEIVSKEESVGRFINQSIKSDGFTLQTAAWLTGTGELHSSPFLLYTNNINTKGTTHDRHALLL